MDWGNIIDSALTIGGALIGAKATKKAAKAGAKSAEQAADLSQRQYEQTRADYAPWRSAGVNALDWLTKLNTPGAADPAVVSGYVKGLPGYQFESDELDRALMARHAKSDNRFGSRGLKEIVRWKDDYLMRPTYDRWTNNLMALAGYGREGNQILANAGAGNANRVGELGRIAADAQAGGYAGQAALWNNTLQQLGQTWAPNPVESAYAAYLKSLTPQPV
jgi:hypothetical protein